MDRDHDDTGAYVGDGGSVITTGSGPEEGGSKVRLESIFTASWRSIFGGQGRVRCWAGLALFATLCNFQIGGTNHMTLGLDYMKSSQAQFEVLMPHSGRTLVVHQQLDKLGLGACIWDCVSDLLFQLKDSPRLLHPPHTRTCS